MKQLSKYIFVVFLFVLFSSNIFAQCDMQLSFSKNDLTCYGGNDGSINTTITDGFPTYIQWSGPLGFSSVNQNINGLYPGEYVITILYGGGCSINDTVTITQPAENTNTITTTDVSCYNGSNGSAFVIGGGPGPHQYAWSIGYSSQVVNNLASGEVSVTVTDNNGCVSTTIDTIFEPEQLTSSIEKTNVTCGGAGDGIAAAIPVGGTAPYFYSWTYPNNSTASDSVITGLGSGTYSLTVWDIKGCTSNSSSTSIQNPPPLNANVSIIDHSCFGISDGAINIDPWGGTPPYSYLWSNGDTANPLLGAAANISQNVVITDASGCTLNKGGTVSQPSEISHYVNNVVDAICYGVPTGSATVFASGGTPPFSIVWESGDTTFTADSLLGGYNSFTFTDENSCEKEDSVYVGFPAPNFLISSSKTDVLCSGGNDGAASVSITGDPFYYNIEWSTSSTQESINNLTAGTYNVLVTDTSGCYLTEYVDILEPADITLTSSTTDALCFGESNGTATINVVGGIAPFSREWYGVDSTALASGTYSILFTDNNNCKDSIEITIDEPDVLAFNISTTDVLCREENNGIVTITTSGGTLPYTENWFGINTDSLVAGTYPYHLIDNKGCEKDTTFIIAEPEQLITSASITNIPCFGQYGAAAAIVTGGTAPYNYQWNTFSLEDSIGSLLPGPYNVIVTDNNDCESFYAFTITEPSELSTTKVFSAVTCYGMDDGWAYVNAIGGTAPISIAWNDGQDSTTAINLSEGTYIATITDANGCQKIVDGYISEPSPTNYEFNINAISCYGESNGAVSLSIFGGSPPFQYDWSNSDTLATIDSLSADIFYSVDVVDENGCAFKDSVKLDQPTQFEVTAIEAYDVNCFGGNDGFIELSFTGGTQPYVENWFGENPTALSAGSYNLYLTDQNGCEPVDTTFIIEEPTEALGLNTNKTDISCYGESNGAAVAEGFGGTAPYSYLWNTFQSDSSINNLPLGVYSITVTDANGCSSFDGFSVTQPTNISTVMSTTDVNCHAGADGTATVNVTGGTAPYTFDWINSQDSATAINLEEGTYTVTVYDANGCQSFSSGSIFEPGPTNLQLTASNPSCNSYNNGTAEIAVIGGSAPFSYSWKVAENTISSTSQATNLSAGINYHIEVSDGDNCLHIDSVTLNQPTAISIQQLAINNVLCHGDETGYAVATATGGTSPYTFSWSNGSTSAAANSLGAGIYTLAVSDANNCPTADSLFTISQPTLALNLSTSQINVSCNGGSDGSAVVNVNGGTAPYEFLWSNFENTQSTNGLAAGVYGITITDNNNCNATTGVSVSEPSVLFSSISSADVTCHGGADGTATVNVFGGTEPYQFLWSDGQAVQTATNLSEGSYSVTVTDDKGCQTFANANIFEPGATNLSFTNVENISCNGLSDGTAKVVVLGGNAPFSYEWTLGGTIISSNQTAINLSANTQYTITITDNDECVHSDSISLEEPNQLNFAALNLTDVSCTGGNNGSAYAEIEGGTAPYNFNWYGNNPNLLSAANYTLSVTDVNDCTSIDTTFNIAEPANPLGVSIDSENVSCNGGNDGFAEAFVSGGTAPYEYLWSNFDNTSYTNGLSQGVINITVTDNNNCSTMGGITITQPTAISTIISSENTSCYGGNDGALYLSVFGGTTPYTFLWNDSEAQTTSDAINLATGYYNVIVSDSNNCQDFNGGNVSEPSPISFNTNITNVSCSGGEDGAAYITTSGGTGNIVQDWGSIEQSALSLGVYTVILSDQNGCIDSTTFTVESETDMVINNSLQQISCSYTADGYIDVSVEGGVTPYQYNWTGPDSFSSTTEDIQELGEGSYNLLVIDNNDCSSEASYTLLAPDTIEIQLDYPEIECANGEGVDIFSYVSGGTLPYSYEWDNGSIDTDLIETAEGVYALIITDFNNCSATDTALVVTSTDCLQIPTGITPNGDGVNDTWILRKIEDYPSAFVRIFDDQGTLLYSVDGYDNETPWDGTFNGNMLPAGVYYYFVQLSPEDSPMTGALSIIK